MSTGLQPFLTGFEVEFSWPIEQVNPVAFQLMFGMTPAEVAAHYPRRPCRHCGQPISGAAPATDRCLVCHKPVGKPGR